VRGEPKEAFELPKPIDITTALQEALALLTPLGIRPVLIGGVALSIYGIERYTKDIDLALTVSDIGLVEPLLQSFDPKPLRIGGISFLTRAGIRVALIDRRVSCQALTALVKMVDVNIHIWLTTKECRFW
jgi:hypothetical protein